MSLKRKAAHQSIAQVDTPDSKRRRGPDTFIANATETPQRTTQAGLEFLEKLKQSTDKQQHKIATHFLLLPDPNELPEYYQVIQMPIALETIEAKLRRFEYPNMSAIESDLKRMISNAKSFNERNSEVHNDAEKIRKLVSNQFKEINPAYADPAYVAVPTPIPGEAGYVQPLQQAFVPPPPTPTPVAPVQSAERPKRMLNLRGPKDSTVRGSQTPKAATPAPVVTAPAVAAKNNDFARKTFQQAQEDILQELCELKNDDGELIAGSFMQLPSRSLKDYYHTVKSPESLLGLKKKATGKVGHAEPTGITLLKTWADFESQVSLIWRNARQYNEDGSDISVLATQLEKHFNKRLTEAKAVIPDPNRPKVKLNVSAKSPEPPAPNPRITLNVGPRPSPSGGAVDVEALRRQQEMIKSATNATSRPSSALPETQSTAQMGASQSPPMQANGIKPEALTPGLAAVPETNGGLANGHTVLGMPPPPAVLARPQSGSPFPPPAGTPYYSSQLGLFDNRLRPQEKTAADAIIQSLDVSSHPSLQHIPADDKIAYTFTPTDRLSQQSFTFSVSAAHSFIRIQPTIQQAASAAQRTTKLGVTLQGHKVQTVQHQYQRHLDEVDPHRPMYDVPLREGDVSRIEVWMLAGPARGAPKMGTGSDHEFERYTLFVFRPKA